MNGRTGANRQTIALYGDSLTNNLFRGLRAISVGGECCYLVSRRAKLGSGLVRDDQFDWVRHIRRYTEIDRPNIIVVSFGGNDRQTLLAGGRRLQLFSRQWWFEYDRRVTRLMKGLTTGEARVYWLGIPIVRSAEISADFSVLNDLIRGRAMDHRIIHIDIWNAFNDDSGRYTDFKRSAAGITRRCRHIDGVHFSPQGENRLAKLVLNAISGELDTVRSDEALADIEFKF